MRFLFEEPEEIPIVERYNVAPTQDVPVIVIQNKVRIVKLMRWGLIPVWAKDESIGNKMINARAETIGEKASFKRPLKYKRCLIPADGFYEWQKNKQGGAKKPLRIVMKSGEPFAFAGLWDNWTNPADGKPVYSFTIITTTANEMMSKIHERMPVILKKEDEDTWLDPDNTDVESLKQFLIPYPSELMNAYEVSTEVNSPSHDTINCIQPL